MDTEVFGVSVDSWASNKAFHSELGLPFDLLSDWEREVAPAYGAFNERELVANRWSYLIDKDGVVRFAQRSGLNEPRDFAAMLDAVEDLYAGNGDE
jgi:peroxiredoxin (alkyl hydroperoxide reductase subunit C)